MASQRETLEEKVQKLEENYLSIITSVIINIPLSYFSIISKNAIKGSLEGKVISLEEKVSRLEAKVKQQESFLFSLKRERSSSTGAVDNKQHTQNAAHRTCGEALATDFTSKSGMYWIDPDGQDIGDDAIHVYCNMTTGIYIFIPYGMG